MNQHINLSLLLLTHNDAEKIKTNFGWLSKCPNISEIIAIDDDSTDSTQAELNKLAAPTRKVKIITRPLNGNFAHQRQFGIGKATNNWILWLDTDEIPDDQLIAFIGSFGAGDYQSFIVPRQTQFLGTTLRHGETGNVDLVRIFNKKSGSFIGPVHEVWLTKGLVGQADGAIIHQSPPTLRFFLEKINHYSSIRAHHLYNEGRHANTLQTILFPLAKFIQNYLLRLGFLDGMPGLILALSMSFHSFLVRAKLWHLWHP